MKTNPKDILKPIVIGITVVFFVYILAPVVMDYQKVESINQVGMVSIGGSEQYVEVRGDDTENPILLFLHGGPGFAESSFASEYQETLRKHFIVVNWDQRGAGKSYSDLIPKETMTIEQFLLDTEEMTDYLKSQYGKDKIYLAGHSWGSIIGMMAVDSHPEDFYAYIGIGQVINVEEGERISYEYVLKEARRTNNAEAISELESIGEPMYGNLYELAMERKWVTFFGGSFKEVNVYELLEKSLDEEAYAAHQKGTLFSASSLFQEFMTVNLFKNVAAVEVPIYFCMSKDDYHAPAQVVEAYMDVLEAPMKKLIWFDQSAHHPNYEEPEKFADVMITIKNETYE